MQPEDHIWKEDFVLTKILFTTSRMQKSFACGLTLTKLQLSRLSICFCCPTSYPMSLSRWSNTSHSMANLYFGKYRSILYFPIPNWWIISSLLKTCMICLRASCSLHNHLFLWSSTPAKPASIFRLCVGFLHLLITYKKPLFDRKISALFCLSFGPDQPPVPLACLYVFPCKHFCRPFNDVPIFSSPENFPTWALLNQFCSALSKTPQYP